MQFGCLKKKLPLPSAPVRVLLLILRMPRTRSNDHLLWLSQVAVIQVKRINNKISKMKES